MILGAFSNLMIQFEPLSKRCQIISYNYGKRNQISRMGSKFRASTPLMKSLNIYDDINYQQEMKTFSQRKTLNKRYFFCMQFNAVYLKGAFGRHGSMKVAAVFTHDERNNIGQKYSSIKFSQGHSIILF